VARLTTAQALVRFLAAQRVERDGVQRRLVEGCLGIFGHGNVAGLGQALKQHADLMPFTLPRNEQAMVHTAIGFARERLRLGVLACTTSVGPGATNLVTGAACATINRLPVLLLPGDVFASRRPHPVLQQLEFPGAGDVSVNDCLRPVSRYFDRITRPEQLEVAALEAMRVLTDPAETGAVTLALPQDVQAEAGEFPDELLEPRVWHVRRAPADPAAVREAAALIRAARRPLIVAGGGAIYSEATGALAALSAATGIPVAETQAGKGSIPDAGGADPAAGAAGSSARAGAADPAARGAVGPSARAGAASPGAADLAARAAVGLGAIGATGTLAANQVAREADLVIGVGTRWSDFTTASHTAFANPGVRFVNVNVAAFDAGKQSGLALVADARAALEQLAAALDGHAVSEGYRVEIAAARDAWELERAALLAEATDSGLPAQAQVIAAVNDAARPEDVMVCAAGSMPGDLHKLWRTARPGAYHVEYGYSTMGYEIAGALGVKLAAPQREVFALVGDGSYLMLSSELATAVQERVKLIVVLVDNRGFASIGALSRSVGGEGFGTRYRYRPADGALDLDAEPGGAAPGFAVDRPGADDPAPAGDLSAAAHGAVDRPGADDPAPAGDLPIDLAANAESLGALVLRAGTLDELRAALDQARAADRTVVVAVRTDRYAGVPSYESWWDVPVAEVSDEPAVQAARADYEHARRAQRPYLAQPALAAESAARSPRAQAAAAPSPAESAPHARAAESASPGPPAPHARAAESASPGPPAPPPGSAPDA
jgi:3D-(3,5/4)-trihydroxycyclohexane-1,2-dione acylhydrolase (decyclizing)